LPIRLGHGCLLLLCRNLLERYGREIKNLLSLREGSLSAGGDKKEGPSKQVLQAGGQVGIGTNAAVPGELGYPAAALLGCPTSAALATGGLGSQQEPPLLSPSPDGLGPDTGSADGESEEGAAGHGDLAASEEGSEQLTSASGAKAALLRPGSVPGAKPSLSSWWAHREGSSAKLLVPAGAEEEERPSITSLQQEQGRDAQAPECSLLPPPNPPAAQEEPLDSSAPHRSGGMQAELQELCQALQLLEGLVERTSPRHRALYQGQPSGTAELPRDTDELRTLLSHHGMFLKQHRVQLPEQVAEVFEQLLALGQEEQDHQTVLVLREALPGECGDEPPVQSDESSLGLPSIPTNGREGKQGELAQQEPAGDHSHDSPEGSDSLGTHSESSSLVDGSAPPFSRTELRKEAVTAIKSKAFWGESDDSSSELEAALRPQTHGTDSDDFDDFYD
uniref:Centrosomal protein kizuna n=1 Tax=Serinus canaria TaxID=9135 RepID=A0A8C9NL92_SERCA